jgi:hypothetical protein
MRTIKLTEIARARVWVGSAGHEIVPVAALRTVAEAAPGVPVPTPHVTVEAFVPVGAMAMYGLLGMRFEPTVDTMVRIEVPHSGAGRWWPESLAGRIDRVRAGLTHEFAEPVLDGVAGYANGRFPAGTITVTEAAQGAIGSSAVMFMRLARCALDLMLNEHPRDDEQLATLLANQLRWRP